MEDHKKSKPVYKILTKLGIELVTIIAGILIALFVNDLQERKHDREMLSSTLNSLSREFSINIENINGIQNKLQRFRDTLEFYEKDQRLSIYDLTTKAPGLTTAELYTTNWQATLSDNSLRLLSFETITLLSRIDSKHEELKDQASILSSILYSPAIYKIDYDGLAYRKVLGVWLGGYMGNEQELIALYKQFNNLIALAPDAGPY